MAKKPVPAPKPTTSLDVMRRPGRGFEEADADAFAIPFLVVLQRQSPQLETVKGAKPGMVYNTATGELFTSLDVVPVLYQRRFVRWAPREMGGGFKGQLTASEAIALQERGDVTQDEDSGRWFFPLPDGKVNPKKCDLLADTRSHFVLLRKGLTPAMIAMASSQIKKSKNWMTAMQALGGDMWGHAWALASKKESNEKGEWFGWEILPSTQTSAAEQAAAEKFHGAILSGIARVKMEDASHTTE